MIPFDPGTPTPTDVPSPSKTEAFVHGVASGFADTSIGMLGSLETHAGYKDEQVLSQDDFESSPFKRDGMKWTEGMTVAMAKTAANKYDDEQAAYDAAAHPYAVGAGVFLGGAMDPLYYIPYADIGAAAIKAGRTALSLDALASISKEASVERMLGLPRFTPEAAIKAATKANPVLRGAEIQALNAAGAATLELPLQDKVEGGLDSRQAGISVATAFVGGGFFGGLGPALSKLSIGQRVSGLAKAAEDYAAMRPVDVAGAVKPEADLTSQVQQVLKAGGIPEVKAGMSEEALRAIRVAGNKAPTDDDRLFLDSFKQDGGESYYQGKLDDLEGLGGIPRMPGLTPEERGVEDNLRAKILGNPEQAKAEYRALDNKELGLSTEGGKILNTDLARELSPEYAASKESRSALAPAVHEPASALIKDLYREGLAQAPKAGEKNLVMIMAGGSGAGKSSSIENVPSLNRLKQKAQIIYDTNFNNYASSKQKIEQALAAGKKVVIPYVARDIVDALTKGTLPRAMRVGRTVLLREHLKTHMESAETFQRLAKEYKGDHRVKFVVIDNTGGPGEQRVAGLSLLRKLDYTNAEDRLRAALESEHENGKISDAVYRGTLGEPAPGAGAPGAPQAAEGGGGPSDRSPVRGEFRPVLESDGAGALSNFEAQRSWLVSKLAAIRHATPDWRSVSPLEALPETPDVSGLPLTDAEKDYVAKGDELKERASGMASVLKVGAACANL